MKREIPVQEAIGMTLAHDVTQIIPGNFKGVAFPKGHVIAEEDVPRLLDMGKRHIYVLDVAADELHEDEAAVRMAHAVAGPGIQFGHPHEGKVVLKARHDGLLVIESEQVLQMNLLDAIAVTTRQPFITVKEGQSVAGVRPIPLTILRKTVAQIERISNGKTIDVWPYLPHRVSIVTTGSEVQSGRVVDKSGPVLREKFAAFGLSVEGQAIVGDDREEIAAAIEAALASGATIVCVTGGMSVDPDDRTPSAIRLASDTVVTHGTPMLPGSMMMVAYKGDAVIFGLPGAVIYDAVTAFDVLLPRALAGWRLTKRDIALYGVGGWLNA